RKGRAAPALRVRGDVDQGRIGRGLPRERPGFELWLGGSGLEAGRQRRNRDPPRDRRRGRLQHRIRQLLIRASTRPLDRAPGRIPWRVYPDAHAGRTTARLPTILAPRAVRGADATPGK